MSASPQERALRRDAFRKMNAREKLDYIFTYYKLPILLGVIALAVIGSAAHRQLTKKEAVLYAAFINVSVGESLEDTLTVQFIARSGVSAHRGARCISTAISTCRMTLLSSTMSMLTPRG